MILYRDIMPYFSKSIYMFMSKNYPVHTCMAVLSGVAFRDVIDS